MVLSCNFPTLSNLSQVHKLKVSLALFFRKPGVGTASISMTISRKSSHSFGTRSIRTTGVGSRSNLFNSSSRKSVVIESSRVEKAHAKPPVQVGVKTFCCFLKEFVTVFSLTYITIISVSVSFRERRTATSIGAPRFSIKGTPRGLTPLHTCIK